MGGFYGDVRGVACVENTRMLTAPGSRRDMLAGLIEVQPFGDKVKIP